MGGTVSFTEAELKAIREEYAKGSTDSQFQNYIREAVTRNLIPGRHLYFQLRTVKEYDETLHTSTYVKRAIHLTSIDFFRLTAQRTGEYQGQKRPVWLYDANGSFNKSDIPLPNLTPYAVEVSVFRKGFLEPLTVTARFDAYAVYYKDGSGFKLNAMWEKRGAEQLAKCGEALALRQAFPEELGGLYIAEEIRDDESSAGAELVQSKPADAQAPPQSTPSLPPFTETAPNSVGVPKAVIPQELTPIADFSNAGATAPEFATKEERTAFVNRLRYIMKQVLPKAGVQNADEVLKNFVKRFTGKDNTKDYTKSEWNNLLGALDTAKEAGTLVNLVTGENIGVKSVSV